MMHLTARMVGAYKGAAASILLLMIVERRPLSQGEMRRGTKYGNDMINDAVWMLREDGLIVETSRYTWALLEDAQQLPIGATPPEPVPAAIEAEIDPMDSELGPDEAEEDSMDSQLGPNGSDLIALASSGYSINNQESKEIPPPLARSASSDLSGPAETADILAALDESGIGEPMRSTLAKLPHVTAALVRYHCGTCDNPGLAIYRIRNNYKIPRKPQHGRDSPENVQQRFKTGKYADFVET